MRQRESLWESSPCSRPIPKTIPATKARPDEGRSRDTQLRQDVRAPGRRGMQQPYSINDSPAENVKNRADRPLLAIMGPMMPLWLKDGKEEALVVARFVQIGQKMACQITFPGLAATPGPAGRVCAEPVSGCPRFQPTREGRLGPSRTSNDALPVELDPGERPPRHRDGHPCVWDWHWLGRRRWSHSSPSPGRLVVA